MLSGGTALEEYATRRASSVLSALAKRMPRIAHRKQDDQILDVDVSQIQIADRLGSWYTLLALAVAAVGWILGADPTRFLAVLVIATPCPLLLAIPIAIIGAVSVAASRGIIIKDPGMLERIDTCRTLIFDKTGTLTYGRPALTDVICAAGQT